MHIFEGLRVYKSMVVGSNIIRIHACMYVAAYVCMYVCLYTYVNYVCMHVYTVY